jgi:hypothetical protein
LELVESKFHDTPHEEKQQVNRARISAHNNCQMRAPRCESDTHVRLKS